MPRVWRVLIGMALIVGGFAAPAQASAMLALPGMTEPRVAWGAQDALDRPFHVNALKQRAHRDVDLSRPCRHRLSSALECQQSPDFKCDEWLGQGAFDRPTQVEPSIQRSDGDTAVPARPFSNGHSTTAERQESIIAPIPGLFHASGPTAILWSVRPVVVDAFNRMNRRWARSHVGKERFERCRPLRAHRNAAATIVAIVLSFRITDAGLSLIPDTSFRSVGIAHG